MPELEESGVKLLLHNTSVPQLHCNYRKVMQSLQNSDLLILLEDKGLNICTFNSTTGKTVLSAPLTSGIIKVFVMMILFSPKT